MLDVGMVYVLQPAQDRLLVEQQVELLFQLAEELLDGAVRVGPRDEVIVLVEIDLQFYALLWLAVH